MNYEDYQKAPEGKFVSVHQFVPDAIIDIRYARNNNFTGAPVPGYYAPYAILTLEAAKALAQAVDLLRAKGYRIIVYDAYRPWKAVKYFVKWASTPELEGESRFFPGLPKLRILSDGYIAERSSHPRGSTVDLGLCDLDGNEEDMGGFFDFFNSVSHHGANVASEAAERRSVLLNAMLHAGFEAYRNEWWHYRLKNEPYPDTCWDFDMTDSLLVNGTADDSAADD